MGNAVDYMDLFIYKGDLFYLDGKLSVSIHQKETNKFIYINPSIKDTLSKTMCGVNWSAMSGIIRKENFSKLRTRFYSRLRNRGFKKYVLTKLFQCVKYAQRNKRLNLEPSPWNLSQPLPLQETERSIIKAGEGQLIRSQGQERTSRDEVTMAETSLHSRITSPGGIDGLLSSS